MSNKKSILRLLFISTITLIVACTPKPHLGDSTETKTADGVSMIQSENRYMLPGDKIGGTESAMISARAVVENIDYKTRKLTVRTQDNRVTSMAVGPEVVNFNQIKRKDQVAIDYFLSVNFEAREPTTDELRLASANATTELSARAAKGQKPGIASVAEGVKIVTVDSIDKTKEIIIFRGAAGDLTAVKAKYPENLSYIKKGDKVVLTLTEAFAARVVPISKIN